MIWTEKAIVASELDELVAYICGYHHARMPNKVRRTTVNGAVDYQCPVEDMGENLNGIIGISFTLSDNTDVDLQIKHLSPGLTHYVYRCPDDDGEHICGIL